MPLIIFMALIQNRSRIWFQLEKNTYISCLYRHTCILNSLNFKLCATFLSGDNTNQLGLRYLAVGFRLCVFRGYLVKLDIEAPLPMMCINCGNIRNIAFLVLLFYMKPNGMRVFYSAQNTQHFQVHYDHYA